MLDEEGSNDIPILLNVRVVDLYDIAITIENVNVQIGLGTNQSATVSKLRKRKSVLAKLHDGKHKKQKRKERLREKQKEKQKENKRGTVAS